MLSALFAAECPISLVRELREADPRSMPTRLWKSLADAGVFGLLLPQEYGGAGGTLADLGSVPAPMSPAAFGTYIAAETEKWAKVIKFANIKAE